MLTLSLLRHAKSSWGDPNLADVARPLNARGEAAAPRVGAEMAALGLVPDRVLCSAAVRTRQTAALVRASLPGCPEPVVLDRLYLATPARILAEVRAQARPAASPPRHILVIGHNPGLNLLALELAAAGPPEAIARLERNLPTAGLVVLAFDVARWRDVGPGTGRIEHFITPRGLAADED